MPDAHPPPFGGGALLGLPDELQGPVGRAVVHEQHGARQGQGLEDGDGRLQVGADAGLLVEARDDDAERPPRHRSLRAFLHAPSLHASSRPRAVGALF